MAHPENIILSSGDSLTREEILEAALLLARSEAEFPLLGEKDARLACLMLAHEMIAFNEEKEII